MSDEHTDPAAARAAKAEADAVIDAAMQSGLISPDIKLGDLIKLGKGDKATTLGYVGAWDRYVVVCK